MNIQARRETRAVPAKIRRMPPHTVYRRAFCGAYGKRNAAKKDGGGKVPAAGSFLRQSQMRYAIRKWLVQYLLFRMLSEMRITPSDEEASIIVPSPR